MFTKIFSWIKNNKLSSLLLVVLGYFLIRWGFYSNQSLPLLKLNSSSDRYLSEPDYDATGLSKSSVGVSSPLYQESAPAPEVTDRMVVQNSNLSLQVKDVSLSIKEIQNTAESFGGYFVSSSLSRPEEATSGNITVRVPSDSLEEVLEKYRSLSIKVVAENLYGYDVTDQYVDIQSRLAAYYKTKFKFEQILDQANTVEELLKVNRELINLQSQIDRLIGQQEYLEKTSQNSLVTVYLSTDEFSLPWAPEHSWRPEVVFKQSVRALVTTLRGFGTKLIWVAVYSVIWVPVLLIGYFVYRWLNRKAK